MGVWTSAGKGIRYKEHPTRKHGKRPDRYWCLQYRLRGKTVNEAVGWWSDGVTQSQCEELMGALRVNQKSGQGPQTLKEMREYNHERRLTEAAAKEASAHRNQTLLGFWESEYLPRAVLTLAKRGIDSQRTLMRLWLAPVANKPLRELTSADLENLVMRPMAEAGRSPGRIRYALTVVSVVWTMAAERGLVSGENPVRVIKKPRLDDKRDRFLTRTEAIDLLAALNELSPDSHDVALLSLFSGLRIGECLALTWADIDQGEGTIFVKDTKVTRNRHAYINAEIEEMLNRRREYGYSKSSRVFDFSGSTYPYSIVRKHFALVVKGLGLNDGVTDGRQRVVIHTLRHTFASWLVQRGTPLYTVSKLMGHSSIKMTERYAHLAPDTQRAAAMDLEGILRR
ncbi:site-specific integrase [Deltaproteobacteria bacterium OttesenSCG-928-M10]|nr:site-specific integrase [Deltaproteobacteria bacterium OttesenSCG-928-M10]